MLRPLLADVDDLESIDALESYIDASQVIMLFCSKGYFQSKNCLREVRSTMEKGKRFCLMHDPEKGGATLEVVQQECPEELRGDIFNNKEAITWRRIRDFQMVSLEKLGEATLLGSPAYRDAKALPLYLPGAITTKQWMFWPAITVYCSPNNPGCERNAQALRKTLGTPLGAEANKEVRMFNPGLTVSTSKRRSLGGQKPSHMILYLNEETFVGEVGENLAAEVREAREAGMPIVMLHQCDPKDGGCEVPPAAVSSPAP